MEPGGEVTRRVVSFLVMPTFHGQQTKRRRQMQDRMFGRTGRNVSEIGFGAWAIGASWGQVMTPPPSKPCTPRSTPE